METHRVPLKVPSPRRKFLWWKFSLGENTGWKVPCETSISVSPLTKSAIESTTAVVDRKSLIESLYEARQCWDTLDIQPLTDSDECHHMSVGVLCTTDFTPWWIRFGQNAH